EGSRKGKHYLSERTADRLLRHLEHLALPGREELNVTFYGGEPLLSFERMLALARRMRALCDAGGIPFRFSLITNGTLLTRARVARLRPLGLKSASVTLDGPRETHDAARPFRSGAGSFDLIVRNLREVADLVDLQIGGNFTRENHRGFPRLLDDLAAAGLTPGAISQVRFDPVIQERAGIAHADFHGGCTTLDEPWHCEASVWLREEILRRGYRTGRIMPARCMMDVPGHPVVNHDGVLYPCPGLIGREEFRMGTIDDVPAQTRSPGTDARSAGDARPRSLPAPRAWHNETCLACAYLPLCLGGCRYMSLLRTGSADGVDCRKAYFDAVLEQLVLQDIRYGVQP
ncbi:MAG TPA: SPASM domain-containing protein, partial [Candidatus Methanoperedens sp.]|nr:SPASM domain-containing protein [Candidatus Methanoperedens sp.]